MSEYEQVIDEIVRHGVVVKVNKIVDDNYIPYERKYVGCVVELDFSEHDKVFEDKIAELENIINHKLGDWDKHGITYQEILDMKSKNDKLKQKISDLESLMQKQDEFLEMKNIQIAELKQRIAELESKETEKFSEIDTSNPLACAESLIEHMTHLEKYMIMPERDVQTFSVEELKEIADYLMVYYRHHRDRDAEVTISF